MFRAEEIEISEIQAEVPACTRYVYISIYIYICTCIQIYALYIYINRESKNNLVISNVHKRHKINVKYRDGLLGDIT